MRTEVLRTQNPETIKMLEKHVPERVYWIAYIERLAFFALTDFAGWQKIKVYRTYIQHNAHDALKALHGNITKAR